MTLRPGVFNLLNGNGQNRGAASAEASDTERAVPALEGQWVQTEIHRDRAALERILDDRFVGTFGSHKTVGKEEFIKGIIAGTGTVLSEELTDRIVLLADNAAVVVETDTAKGKNAAGEPWNVILRITTTYIKRDDGRQVALAEQIVSGKPPKVSNS